MAITRKRWTTEEETLFLEHVEEIQGLGKLNLKQTFEEMATWDRYKAKNRTPAALDKRYSDLTNTSVKNTVQRAVPVQNDFLEGIQALKNGYESVIAENEQLRKRVDELEKQLEGFEMMARVMEQARKMVVDQELGQRERPRFKMDQNGNLNRV